MVFENNIAVVESGSILELENDFRFKIEHSNYKLKL